jgi:hypothetical protein
LIDLLPVVGIIEMLRAMADLRGYAVSGAQEEACPQDHERVAAGNERVRSGFSRSATATPNSKRCMWFWSQGPGATPRRWQNKSFGGLV